MVILRKEDSMKIPVYPDDFYNYKDGVEIDNHTINEWIHTCLENLENYPNGDYAAISSGNTRVDVVRYTESGEVHYHIHVNKGYEEVDTGYME
jgi:hypothetical protein